MEATLAEMATKGVAIVEAVDEEAGTGRVAVITETLPLASVRLTD